MSMFIFRPMIFCSRVTLSLSTLITFHSKKKVCSCFCSTLVPVTVMFWVVVVVMVW